MNSQTLEEFLRSRIIGQQEVLSQIAALIDRATNGFRYREKPMVSVLALGPTGVGKTETVRLVCKHMFGSEEEHLLRLDMSEYMVPESRDLLLGGQHRGVLEVLYDKTGQEGVLLFDEVEKAHPLILDLLLQMLSAARVTVAGGRVLDLRKYLVFCTSNIGGEMLMRSESCDYDTIQERAVGVALQYLRPELVNRVDLLAAFNKLGSEVSFEIATLHARECVEITQALGHNLNVTENCLKFIQREGYSDKFGARPIQRAAMEIIGGAVRRYQRMNGVSRVSGFVDYSPATGQVALVADNGNAIL